MHKNYSSWETDDCRVKGVHWQEYRSNSHKSREEISNPSSEKKIEKVISGSAKSKKKGGIQKLANIFIADDVDDVKMLYFRGHRCSGSKGYYSGCGKGGFGSK